MKIIVKSLLYKDRVFSLDVFIQLLVFIYYINRNKTHVNVSDLEIINDLSWKGYKTLLILQPSILELFTLTARKLIRVLYLVVEGIMTDKLEIKCRLNEEHGGGIRQP